MIFTQEQIDEIEQKLAKRGAKDTQLPPAKTPLTGDETIAIVQERENRLVPIGSIVNTDGGIFNVSEYLKVKTEADTSVILTLSEALEACPNRVKKAGQIITFIDKDKEWQRYQYQGYNAENWNQLTLWKDLNNISEDMPVSEDVMTFNITEYMPGGSKYKQSIWAGIYTIDGNTPVSQYRLIFGCDESLGNVEGIDMDTSDTLAIIDVDTDEVTVFNYILFVGNSIDGYRYQTTILSDEDVPDWIAKAFGNNSFYIAANIESLERRVNTKLVDKSSIVRVDDYLNSSKEMPNGYFMFEQQPVSQIRVLYDSNAYLLYIQVAVDGTGTMYFAFENFDEYYDSWRYLNQYTENNCPSHILEAFGLNEATSNKKGMMSATDKTNLDGSFKNVSYNSTTKKLIFTKNNSTTVELDATPFIKDGMINSVSIVDGYLVITFNTDAGKEPISIALTDIFNPANYYDKDDVDDLLAGKVDKIEGKGLSTNDYTDSDKEKVSSITLPDETYSISQNQWILDGNIATNSEGVLKIEATSWLTPTIVNGRLVLTRSSFEFSSSFKIYSPFEGTLRIRCYEWTDSYKDWQLELGYLTDYPEKYHYLEPFYESSDNTDIAIYVKAGWNTIRGGSGGSNTGPLIIAGISLQKGILALNSRVTEHNMGLMSPGHLTQLVNKVDKVTGKGLSTNDYTTEEKSKLGALPTNAELTQALGGKANTADLAPVATSGSYNDLSDKPTIPTVPTNVSAFTNDAGYLTQHQDITGKADKVSNATNGNFTALDSNGNLVDSGHKHSDYLTEHQSLSNYIQKSQTAGFVKNDGTIDTNTYLTQHQDISGKANKNEMSVVQGTGADADKTTITLKQGTSATVLTTHQDVSGKENVMPITTATDATLSAVVGNYYRLDNVGTLAITLPTIVGATKLQAITFLLVCGSSALVTFAPQGSETILYQENFALEADTTYEVTALWNGSEWTLSRVIYE